LKRQRIAKFAVSCLLILLSLNVAKGEIGVGVKKGDWIEYEVTTWGSPPEEFKVRYARIEILEGHGAEIIANVTTEALNGSASSLLMTFNLEKGKIGAWFIIPAGLSPGESFFDESMGRYVAVEGEERLIFGGATRTVTKATTSERLKLWDKSTGIFVECVDVFDSYSINATAIKTNMWSTQPVGLDPWSPMIVGLFIFAPLAAALFMKRSNLKSHQKLSKK
jgi:hypothetical protein